jgi:hypothetical protein
MRKVAICRWIDQGTYTELVGDYVRVPRLEIDAATAYIDVDGSGNLIFVDGVSGSQTLAQLLAGGGSVFTKNITSAANAGAVTVATVTTQPCVIQSVVVRSNGATTADLTSIAVTGGASNVVTFLSAVEGVRANIAAADQQIFWEGAVTLAATKTIVITLVGGGATAVDLQVDILYRPIVTGGTLA